MGIFDKIKRTVQRIIPGGKTGKEPKKKEAGVLSVSEGARGVPAGSKVVSKSSSPSDALKGKGVRTVSKNESLRGKLDIAREKQGKGPSSDEDFELFERASGGPISNFARGIKEDPKGLLGAAALATGEAGAQSIAIGIGGLIAKVASKLGSSGSATLSRVAAEAARMGVDPANLQKEVDKAIFSQATKDLAAIATKKTFIGLTKKRLTVAASTLVGGSVLTQWLAADNAAGAASFMSTKIQSRFDNNELTRDDALEQIDGQIAIIKGADKFTKLNTIINPALWAFRKMYVSTVENNLATAEESKRLIEISPETTASKFDRLREESDARDQAFADKQEARDEAFAEGQEKSKRESDAEFSERTLLFEAIRKRNAGTELTPEEMALLIKYGLDTKIVQSGGYEAPSALNFGLF